MAIVLAMNTHTHTHFWDIATKAKTTKLKDKCFASNHMQCGEQRK